MKFPSILVLNLLLPIAFGAEIPAPSGDAIVDSSAKLELLFTREAPIEGGLTEGPAVGPDGAVYFSDIRRGENPGVIHRFAPKTGETTVFAANSHKSNGLVFGPDGKLYAAEGADYGGRRISVGTCSCRSGRRSSTVSRASASTLRTTFARTAKADFISPTRATRAMSLASWSTGRFTVQPPAAMSWK